MPLLTFPVEAIKPFVFLNVSNATFLITQSLCAVISEGRKDYKVDSENFLRFYWTQIRDSENFVFAGTFSELPAQFLNEFFSSGGDVSWEVNGINAL